jgi:Ca2+-binding EF-hand superfamily protein
LDHDGFLSLNEFVSMGKGAKPAPAPAVSSKPAEPPKLGSGAKPAAESFVATTPKQIERLAMFDKRDSNGDGKLTLEEFLSGQPDPGDTAHSRFTYYDVDKDGFLSREEYVKELVKGDSGNE